MAFVLSMWRLGSDLGFAGPFAIRSGILSHWQVWLAISVAIQFIAVLLNRYGTPEQEPAVVEMRETRAEPVREAAAQVRTPR